MLSLPKRPGPYILALLLIILGVLTAWMLRVLEDPAIKKAVQTKASRTPPQPAPDAPLQLIPPRPPLADTSATDPVILELHQEMLQEETPPERELEIIQDLLSQHNRALGPGTFGVNNDVTRALVGDTGDGIWLPRTSPRIRDGELLDRWGTPYWFHASGDRNLEIRSAGPDKNLFTSDDLILNPSPSGLGATPEQAPAVAE